MTEVLLGVAWFGYGRYVMDEGTVWRREGDGMLQGV